jgi:hypothetical protein
LQHISSISGAIFVADISRMPRIEMCSAQAFCSATVFLREIGISRPIVTEQIAEMAYIIHASMKGLNARFVIELLLVKYGFIFMETFCISEIAYSEYVENGFKC